MALSEQSPNAADPARKIVVDGVSKTYDSVQALSDVSLSVREGEFCCIVGPSGCGKTTLLRTIAGLEAADSGSVLVDGDRVTEPGLDRGMVFQEYALFPWRTVRGNIRFGLDRPACDCPDPEILLLDEPFGSVDARTRDGLHEELLDIWAETRQTVVFVTHDIDEAVKLADSIVVLDDDPGTVQSTVTVDVDRPRERTSREFVDHVARIRCKLGQPSDTSQGSMNGNSC